MAIDAAMLRLPLSVRWLIAERDWWHGFALLGDLLSLLVQRRVSKETHPDIRVSLRSTSLSPVLLRGPAYKGRPWPFKPLAASMRLVPLRNTYARPADGEFARLTLSRFRSLGVVGSPAVGWIALLAAYPLEASWQHYSSQLDQAHIECGHDQVIKYSTVETKKS